MSAVSDCRTKIVYDGSHCKWPKPYSAVEPIEFNRAISYCEVNRDFFTTKGVNSPSYDRRPGTFQNYFSVCGVCHRVIYA